MGDTAEGRKNTTSTEHGEGAETTLAGLRGDGRGATLALIAGGWALINGFRVVLPALLPRIKADLAIDNASAGFALTVLWALYAGLQLPAGLAADRVPPRRLLSLGAILASLSFAVFYLVPFYAVFVLACALFGASASLYGTPRDMLLTRAFTGSDSTAYSITFAAGSLGAAALPYTATLIAGAAGWRLGILWMLPILLLLGLGLWRQQDRTHRSVQAASTRPREASDGEHSSIPRRLLVLGSGMMILLIFTFQALVSFLPTYLVEEKGLGPGLAAGLLGLLFVIGAIVSPVAGHFADRRGERATMMTLIVVSSALLALLPLTTGLVALCLLVPLLGIRTAVGPLTSAFLVRLLPPETRGRIWGSLRTLFFTLGATGSTVMGLMADAGWFDMAFMALAALSALTLVLWWLITPSGSCQRTPRSTRY